MATVDFFADSGDGAIQQTNASWDTCHDAADGAGVEDSFFFVNSSKFGSSYRIQRGFIPFNTSEIPNEAIIQSATLFIAVFDKENSDNDGDDFIVTVQTSQADPLNLSTADFDQCGAINNPTEGSNRIDIGNIVTGGTYNEFVLNSTGLSWINKNGWTLLGLREGHDVIDSPYGGADSTNNYIRVYDAFTANSPILQVKYYIPSPNKINSGHWNRQ